MWYKSESTIKPLEEDTTSSGVYNYARKNIECIECENGVVYTYDEAKIPKELWSLYEQGVSISADNESMNDMILGLVEVIDAM